MTEKKIISNTDRPLTIDSLCRSLSNIGVESGDTLLVHSSLSSLGWVCGGAQSVILSLKKALGTGGTLVMPAHSSGWSDPAKWENPPVPLEWVQTIYDNLPPFEQKMTPTLGMGVIAELFRTIPGSLRSAHPQVSFSANGKFAEKIVSGHNLTPKFGMQSPLARLYDLDAKVLMLGVGYDSCTCFHLSEALIGNLPVQRAGTAILENGERVWKWFEDYDYDADDFELIGNAFEQDGQVHSARIGNANCRLFSIKHAVDFAKIWLMQNRVADQKKSTLA